MPMLSRNLERAVRRALSIAATRQHEYATLEHLLYAQARSTATASWSSVSA